MSPSPASGSPGPSFRTVLYHDPAPVGGVAVGLLLGTSALLHLPIHGPLLVLGFCGTALAYAVDRVWTAAPEDQVNRPARVEWVRAHVRWLAVETAVLLVGAGAAMLFLRGTTLLWIAALGVPAGLHVMPQDWGPQFLVGVWKPVIIAATWAIGAAVLPVVEAGHAVDRGVLLFAGYRFVFILPNLLLADWTDRAGDAEVGLGPWAAGWSETQVRRAATVPLAGGAVGGSVWMLLGGAPVLIALDALGLLLMLCVVWGLDFAHPRDAFLADLVVAWPLVPALVGWMIV